ncbi:MAG TPA: AgmX/PglI C-terminal domain-containing protein [Polyangiaceae bacterium]|nr:AgmX/PglI C-terminal domain-containing protein [Polyangiaceae bacterium]
MAKAVVTFATYQGGQLVSRDSVTHDIVKVGRDPKSHLRVDDPAASRMHAVIEVASPSEITLIDLGNDPGTYVNGERINKCRLRVGDRIDIGSTQLILENVEADAGRFDARQALGAAVARASEQAYAEPAMAGAGGGFAAPGAPNPQHGYNPQGTMVGGTHSPQAPSARPQAAAAGYAAGGHNPAGHGAPRSYGHGGHGGDHGGNYTYAMVKSGPDVTPDEVELAHVQAAEVMILWGTNVLHVAHLAPPRNFYVGEEQSKSFTCDFFIPAEKLGVPRLPVVVGDQSTIAVVIPQQATGEVETADGQRLSLDQVRRQAQPCAELPGAHQLPLGVGTKARIQLGDIVFQVAAVNAGKPIAHGLASGIDWNVMAYFGLSMLSVGGLIAAMAFFVPPLGLSDDEGIDQDQLYLIQQFLNAAAERELEEEETEQVSDSDADNKEGGTGTRAKGEEGSMGKETSKETNKKYAVQGPQDNQDPHLARQQALREAMEFGMIGLLNTGAAGDPNAPTAPWGRDTSLGTDEVSAMGNMWGDEIGEAFGSGGLGLSGIGEGGGGRGEGIGLGNIGTLGHGAGTGTGQGFGSGHGRLGGSHRTATPQVRMGATQVSGRLPAEVIRRIVRQNYGRFRLCYEQGLGRNPNLEGRVTVRFVIGRDGAVSNVSNGGSDLPDSNVVGCVVKAFYGLSFPKPEGGIVTVSYPIMLQPG